ncbi:MAG: bifunctional DNA primase/polymerase [Oligoflexia bacterium]|nr:bifunctional DNA primase/polymerase [Oligoflexia bacterium]
MPNCISPNLNANLLSWALYYAAKNLPVLPLHHPQSNGLCSCQNPQCKSIGKHPMIKDYNNKATTDQSIIKEWWCKWPEANIGILTGSKSKIFVVDIDPRHGGIDSIELWEKTFFSLGKTSAVVRSGGNGLHYYFKSLQSEKIKNQTNILPGIDIRGEGGYIVAPPSNHVNGKIYSWEISIDKVIDAPNLNFLEKKKGDSSPRSNKFIGEGSRNTFLASLAGGGHEKKWHLVRTDSESTLADKSNSLFPSS